MADDKRDDSGSTKEDHLEPFWAVLRPGWDPKLDPNVDPETQARQRAREHPGDLVLLATRGRELVRIHPDGTMTYGEGYTPDEAAVVLWTAIGRQRLNFDRRMQYLDLLELHIALLSVADQAYEAAQVALRNAMGNAETSEREREALRFREEMSRRAMEVRVHGVIEFAREFAGMRPDLIETARTVIRGGQEPPTETN